MHWRTVSKFLIASLAIALAVALAPVSAEAGHPRHCGYGYRGVGYGGWGGGWGCNNFSFSIGCAPIRTYCRPITYCRPVNYCWSVPICPPVRCYDPCLSYGYSSYRYNSYYYPAATYGVFGSTFEPAENAFGPQAVERFLGTSRPVTPAVVVSPKIVMPPLVAKKPFDPSTVRPSNATQLARADQWLAQGDVLFKEQKYHSAAQRYKLAGEAAPDQAEAFWRLGHAYVASNRYPEAAENFRRAIALSPAGVARDGFDLNKLYGGATVARDSHLESLAAVALVDGANSDSLFLLGVTLKYQGQADRAAPFFTAAAKLADGDAKHLAAFLPAKKPAADAKDVIPVAAELEI